MANDLTAVNPEVWVHGERIPYLQCLSVQDNVGDALSRCYLRYSPAHLGAIHTTTLYPEDVTTPTALTDLKLSDGVTPLKAGMRVVVFKRITPPPTQATFDANIYFAGMLANRLDSSNPDSLIWECVDDKWILGGMGGITVHGALVASPNAAGASKRFQYCSSTIPVFNPNGMANCIGIDGNIIINGVTYSGMFPVFTPYAQQIKIPNEILPENALSVTTNTYWTPYLAMKYMWLWLMLNSGATVDGVAVRGLNSAFWRSISPDTAGDEVYRRILFPVANVDTIHAWDPIFPSSDLANKKLQTMVIQGKKSLLVLNDICKSMSTMGMRTVYAASTANDPTTIKSTISFFTLAVAKTVGYQTPQYNGNPLSVTLDVLVGGNTDSGYVQQFSLSDRREDCVESCLVEGESTRLESNFVYDPADSQSKLWPNSQLLPAWSDAQELAFKQIINGGPDGYQTPPYAWIPRDPTKPDSDFPNEWIKCDGNNGRPLAYSNHESGLEMARRCYPNVFIAFRLCPSTTQMKGYQDSTTGVFAFGSDTYPSLPGYKAIMKEQDQPVVFRAGGSVSNYEDDIYSKFPMRVQVKIDPNIVITGLGSDDGYADVVVNHGTRIDPDGTIFFEGLGEKVDGDPYCCLYSGFLIHDPMHVTMKKFKVNAALKLDHRVFGTYVCGTVDEKFDGTLRWAMGGAPQLYIDGRNGLIETNQVNSYPAAYSQFGSDDLTTPLNRILPPTDGRYEAEKIASRRALFAGQVKRDAKYILPKIDSSYKAGVWIDNLHRTDAGYYVPIEAAIQSVTWDFVKQETEIGGIINNDEG